MIVRDARLLRAAPPVRLQAVDNDRAALAAATSARCFRDFDAVSSLFANQCRGAVTGNFLTFHCVTGRSVEI